MKPSRRTLLLALLLGVAGGLAWWLWPEADPIFHGKPESAWIKGIEYNGGDEQTKQWREFGPEGVRVLIRGLERADRRWERFYRGAYQPLAPRLPFGLARLLPAPQDDSGRVTRMCVISLLSRLGKDAMAAAPAVARTLKSEDRGVRQIAIGFFNDTEDDNCLLNKLDPKLKQRLLPEFIRAMQDTRDWGLRNNAALALKYYPEQAQAVAPVLVKALQDSVPAVRLLAAVALNRVDPETAKKAGAVSVVTSVLKDPDDQVAHRAAAALRDFQSQADAAVPALIEALQSTNTLVVSTAVRSLERAFQGQADRIVPALTQAAERNDNVAKYAVAALKHLEAEAALAKLTAQQILEKMATTYATCNSYRDSGVVTNFFNPRHIVVKPFRTAFVRPDRFRFEYDDPTPEKRYVVWAKGNDVRTWWYIKPGAGRPPSLQNGIAGATGVSGGSAHTVPALLLPDRIGGRKLTAMTDLKRVPDETLGRTPCFKLEGRFANAPMTLWLEKSTYLVLRIAEDTGLTKDTTVYRPQVHVEIPAKELEFGAPEKE